MWRILINPRIDIPFTSQLKYLEIVLDNVLNLRVLILSPNTTYLITDFIFFILYLELSIYIKPTLHKFSIKKKNR